jgi:hypothetical protein
MERLGVCGRSPFAGSFWSFVMSFFEKASGCGCVRTIEYPPKPIHADDLYCSKCGANLGSDIQIVWPPRPETQ